MTGFSAHAEIDPMPGNDAGVDARLLRPRGDRPDLLVLTRYAGMASPPTRRSTRFEIITDFCLSQSALVPLHHRLNRMSRLLKAWRYSRIASGVDGLIDKAIAVLAACQHFRRVHPLIDQALL